MDALAGSPRTRVRMWPWQDQPWQENGCSSWTTAPPARVSDVLQGLDILKLVRLNWRRVKKRQAMSKEAIVVVFMSCFRVVMTTSSLSSTSISQFSDLPRRKGSETETPASTLPPPPLSTSVADSSGQGRPRVKKDHNSMGPPVDLGYLYAVPKSTTGLYSFWSDLSDRDPGNTSPNVSRSFFTSVSLAKESSLSSSTTFMSTRRTVLDSVEFKVSEISTSSTANSGFQAKTDHLSKQEDQDQQQQHHHQHHQHQHHHHNRFPHTIVFQAFEIFLCIFLSCFIMLVVVGNAYVILAVCVFEKMRTLSNGLIASLATADFMVALAVMPISLHRELTKGQPVALVLL